MLSSEENAERWERGCAEDPVRNAFLIPKLIRILGAAQPSSILDVGTGTGYVARLTDASLSYRPEWTLADIDTARLAVAKRNAPKMMRAQILSSDITTHEFGKPFEAVIATFTLLEIEDVDCLIQRLPELVCSGGLLVVSLPDTWRDVIGCAASMPEKISEFLEGRTAVPKIDKFTNERYPFRAVRIEHLISRVLATGFELVELTESNEDRTQIYLLAFRRKGVMP